MAMEMDEEVLEVVADQDDVKPLDCSSSSNESGNSEEPHVSRIARIQGIQGVSPSTVSIGYGSYIGPSDAAIFTPNMFSVLCSVFYWCQFLHRTFSVKFNTNKKYKVYKSKRRKQL